MKNLYLWISATCSVDRWAWKRDSPLFSGFFITSWNWNVETPSECPLGYLPCHIRYYTMVYTYYLWTCILEHDHNTWDTMFASEQGWPPFEAEILSPLWPRYLVKLLLGLEAQSESHLMGSSITYSGRCFSALDHWQEISTIPAESYPEMLGRYRETPFPFAMQLVPSQLCAFINLLNTTSTCRLIQWEFYTGYN